MLITNATLIPYDDPRVIDPDSAVYIEGDRIVEMGPNAELTGRYPDAEQIDARGQYVMPGNICAHTHYYGAYSRGMGIPGAAPKDFPEILNKLWWPLDKALDQESIYHSAMVCLVDAVKHGTTTLIDHHASPNAIEGSLDIIASALQETGLRGALCYEVTDRDGPEKARAGIEENVRFMSRVRDDRSLDDRLGAMFGLHASLTLSDETLEACRSAVEQFGQPTGFHVHAAEHSIDEFDALQKYGMRVVDRLKKFDVLGPKSIVAHAVHIDAREVEILADTGTWVSHQPRSNMNNGVGLPAVESMMRAGVRVCLGNDGFSNGMWDEWKAAYLAHKLMNRDPRWMAASTVEQMAVDNNRSLAQIVLGGARLGVIAPGAVADLIFVDYHPYTPLNAGNLPWQIVFGFENSMVTTTIAAGKVLMRDRVLQNLDEEKIMRDALQYAPVVWKRYEEQAGKAA